MTFGKQATYRKLFSPVGTQGIPNPPHSPRSAPWLRTRFHSQYSLFARLRPTYPLARKEVLTLYCLEILLARKLGEIWKRH